MKGATPLSWYGIPRQEIGRLAGQYNYIIVDSAKRQYQSGATCTQMGTSSAKRVTEENTRQCGKECIITPVSYPTPCISPMVIVQKKLKHGTCKKINKLKRELSIAYDFGYFYMTV